MVVVKRNNFSLMCLEIGRVETWIALTAFLEEQKAAYEEKGYDTCWDNEHSKSGLIAWKEGESYFFGIYTKRMPKTKREFVW